MVSLAAAGNESNFDSRCLTGGMDNINWQWDFGEKWVATSKDRPGYGKGASEGGSLRGWTAAGGARFVYFSQEFGLYFLG